MGYKVVYNVIYKYKLVYKQGAFNISEQSLRQLPARPVRSLSESTALSGAIHMALLATLAFGFALLRARVR
jgi:hypothetical protein